MTAIIATPVNTAAASMGSAASGAAAISGVADNTMIASNFTTFLQLLTTQLKNQNPLDPLDTNQFTQQLVQFAQGRAADEIERPADDPGVAGEKARNRPRRSPMSAPPWWWTARPRSSPTAARPGTSMSPSPRPRPSRSRMRPARPPIPAPSPSIRAIRNSPGTAAATTASCGRTAITR